MTLQQLKERVDEALAKGVHPLTAVKLGNESDGHDCVRARMDDRHTNFQLVPGFDGT